MEGLETKTIWRRHPPRGIKYWLPSQPQGLQQLAEEARLSWVLIPSDGNGRTFPIVACRKEARPGVLTVRGPQTETKSVPSFGAWAKSTTKILESFSRATHIRPMHSSHATHRAGAEAIVLDRFSHMRTGLTPNFFLRIGIPLIMASTSSFSGSSPSSVVDGGGAEYIAKPWRGEDSRIESAFQYTSEWFEPGRQFIFPSVAANARGYRCLVGTMRQQ